MSEPIARPAFAAWLWERGLKAKDAAESLGVSHMTVRRICLPFGDPGRRIPDEPLLGKIVHLTAGAITASDFYPPHLTADPAALSLARAQ